MFTDFFCCRPRGPYGKWGGGTLPRGVLEGGSGEGGKEGDDGEAGEGTGRGIQVHGFAIQYNYI